jgi:NAD(P)-dependent dehydrogenase (short-subunit alcohol dehydrogenase family)
MARMIEDANVAVVAGASLGLGSAVCRALSERGLRVVALGRRGALRDVSDAVPGVVALECDLTNAADVDAAFTRVEATVGTASVLVYNAHRLELRSSAETPLDVFEAVWRVNCFGAYVVASRVLPRMLAQGGGTVIFTGATASTRGGKRTAAFASSKFALRGLAQSFARELGPRGIHVAHVVLDGLVWSDRTRARFSPEAADCMEPEDVARVFVSLVEQRRSAWTHELDLRPWVERF